LRRLRTITQMIFESVPQLIIQILMMIYLQDLGVTPLALGSSIGLAGAHLIFETFLLYLEKTASLCSFKYYTATFMNARLNWIPFIERISRYRDVEESRVYDYQNIKYKLCGKYFIMDYKFLPKPLLPAWAKVLLKKNF